MIYSPCEVEEKKKSLIIMQNKQTKNILLGITGGIAAYKCYDLISELTKQNINVKVIPTKSACEFVSPLVLKTLSNNKVYIDQFDYDIVEPLHIEILDNIDLCLICPATANTIAKLAHGICDDLLTSMVCAYSGKLLIAPAMNTNMWNNPITQDNLQILQDKLNATIINPVEGNLACNTVGIGKLAPIDNIIHSIKRELYSPNSLLKDKKVLITAGGTKENLDPVRYIGNYSSGKMGLSLADQAYYLGADVTLVTTNTEHVRDNLENYNIIHVQSSAQMLEQVNNYFEGSDYTVMSSAVADFVPVETSSQKIKKSNLQLPELDIKLKINTDILASLGQRKQKKQILIGFAAESENLEQYAQDKLIKKNLDYIIANDISQNNIGFGSDYNEVLIIDQSNTVKLPRDSKDNVAQAIWQSIIN